MDQTAPLSLRIEQPPQTLREIVLDRLRSAIISGYFKSGERLVERHLCDQLGVSRSVVREVIRTLESECLVEIMPNRGPMVAELDWAKASQIYEIRLLLEQSAAAACAATATAATKTALRTALADIGVAVFGDDARGQVDATTRFYQVIFIAAGHDVAWEIVQRLNRRISRLRTLTLTTTDRHVSGLACMAELCDAIADNDPAAAARAVQDYLTEAALIARRLLEAEERPGGPD